MTDSFPTEGDPTDHITVAVNANPVSMNRDDDGMAIDEYFEAANPSGIPRDYLGTGSVVSEPLTTRILVNTIAVPFGQCQYFFPADPNRQTLFLSYLGIEEAVQGLVLTSEKTATTYPFGAGLVGGQSPAATGGAYAAPVEVNCHTGAVWITNTGSVDTVITVTSVTV